MSDHLGSVRVVISDVREAKISTTLPTTIEAFYPDVQMWADYTAFGSELPGRTAMTDQYRYAYNGKEKDDEIKDVSGSSYDFGARMFDSRLGRWFSVDPLDRYYSSFSPYNYAINCPIKLVDPDGREVKNADEIRRKQWVERVGHYQTRLDDLEKQYGKLDKKTIKKQFGRAAWREVKKAKSILEYSKEQVATYTWRSDKTAELIERWKRESPNIFHEANTATNEDGEIVDMMLGVEQMDGTSRFGYNKLGYYKKEVTDPTTGNVTELYRPSSEFGENTIVVMIDPDVRIYEKDKGPVEYALNHEAGHFIVLAKMNDYIKNFYKPMILKQGKTFFGGHHKDDPSGKKAREFGAVKDITP